MYGACLIWRMFLINLEIVLIGSPGCANGRASTLHHTLISVGGKDLPSVPLSGFSIAMGPIGGGKHHDAKLEDDDMLENPHRLILLSGVLLPFSSPLYNKSCELTFTRTGGLEKETIWRRIFEKEEMVCTCR